jgi:hypothetical protein
MDFRLLTRGRRRKNMVIRGARGTEEVVGRAASILWRLSYRQPPPSPSVFRTGCRWRRKNRAGNPLRIRVGLIGDKPLG